MTQDNGRPHRHSYSDQLTLEQKLEKLVTHWIDHNNSHKETFHTWAARAKEEGLVGVAEKIQEAAALSDQVTALLKQAQTELTK